MTATKGMIWKTPWRRRTGGLVNQPPMDMWFFDLSGGAAPAQDGWQYVSPAPLPSFAAATPFWLGLVCRIGGVDPAAVAPSIQGILNQRLGLTGVSLELEAQYTSQASSDDTENGIYSVYAAPSLSLVALLVGTSPPGVLLQYDWECVSVLFARVTPTQVEAWLDNVYLGSQPLLGPYVPANQSIRLRGGLHTANGPTVHGAVGGTGPVTDAQVAQWFEDVKSGAQIVGIPGQTTDLWSAAAVQPLVPNPLPNVAGGQALNLTAIGAPGQPPSNVLVPVSFNY